MFDPGALRTSPSRVFRTSLFRATYHFGRPPQEVDDEYSQGSTQTAIPRSSVSLETVDNSLSERKARRGPIEDHEDRSSFVRVWTEGGSVFAIPGEREGYPRHRRDRRHFCIRKNTHRAVRIVHAVDAWHERYAHDVRGDPKRVPIGTMCETRKSGTPSKKQGEPS